MSKKFQDKLYVKKELSLTDKQLDRAIKKMKERHPLENWFFVRRALNGEERTYFNVQFIRWIKDVYLNRTKHYLDLEIEFFEREIKEICSELNVECKSIKYSDMSVRELATYFDKTPEYIRLAICKIPKELKEQTKYVQDDVLYVSADGVEWIHKNIYRKSYLEQLEKIKLSLEGNKID